MATTFDVFLSHNSSDRNDVERVARKLSAAGVTPWLDAWELTPGGDWQTEIDRALAASKAFAVCLGANGIGDWAREELRVARDRSVKDPSFRLLPVLLPRAPDPLPPDAMPSFLPMRTWVDLRPGLDDRRAFEDLVRAVRGLPFGAPAATPRNGECPYVGLKTFDEDDARFFFGREADIQRLVERLKGSRFLAVVGPSGSGKSSVVRAGLVPAIREGALPGSAGWSVRRLRPGGNPLTTLAAIAVHMWPELRMRETLDELMADQRALHLAVASAGGGMDNELPAMLVIDQLEEVFTLCSDERERTQFLGNLGYAASIPHGLLNVVVTLRADFYPRCAAYPQLAQLLSTHQFLLGSLPPEGFRAAIQEPAQRAGLRFEEGLRDTILQDLGDQPGALPLLQHALLELWTRRRGDLLTLEGYRESGGVAGAIAKRADATFEAFPADEQAIARRAMLRLTQPGEGTDDTRRRARISELLSRPEDLGAVKHVIEQLVDARLLTASADESTNEEFVDVSHEALIRAWPRLRAWLDEDRAGLLIQRRLSDAASEWDRLGREEGALYRSAHLQEALGFAERHADLLNQLEHEFIAASVALSEQERASERERQHRELEDAKLVAASERRSARLLRVVVLVLVLGLVASGGAAVLAVVARNRSSEQEKKAATQAILAQAQALQASAGLEYTVDPHTATILALSAAHRLDELPESDRPSGAVGPQALDAVGVVLPRVIESPADQRVLSIDAKGAATLWNSDTGVRIAPLDLHNTPATAASFTPDGAKVVIGGLDGKAWTFDADGTEVSTFSPPPSIRSGAVLNVAITPDSRYAVTAYRSQTLAWDVHNPALSFLHFRGPYAGVSNGPAEPGGEAEVAISPNGLALWRQPTNAAEVTNVGTGCQHRGWSPAFIPGTRQTSSTILTTTFNTEGSRVFSSDTKGKAFISDVAPHVTPGRTIHVPSGGSFYDGPSCDVRSHSRLIADITQPVLSAGFSPDGSRIVASDLGGTTSMVDADTGKVLFMLPYHGVVVKAAFDPSGRYIATGGVDGTLRIWDERDGSQVGSLLHSSTSLIVDLTFAGEDRVIAMGSDGVAVAASVPDARQLFVLRAG